MHGFPDAPDLEHFVVTVSVVGIPLIGASVRPSVRTMTPCVNDAKR